MLDVGVQDLLCERRSKYELMSLDNRSERTVGWRRCTDLNLLAPRCWKVMPELSPRQLKECEPYRLVKLKLSNIRTQEISTK